MVVIEYDRNKRLPGKQRQFLDKMDHDMDSGITLGDKHQNHPDTGQKSQFIAIQLVHALINNDETLIAATCSYLVNRLPDLKQVKARQEQNETVSIELVFDRYYSPNEKPVRFLQPGE